MLATAGNIDVYILTRQENGCGRIHVKFEHDGRIIVRLNRRYRRGKLALFSLASSGRGRHCNHAIALRHHLAGEYEATLLLVLAQRVFNVLVAKVIAAALGAALAGTAHAIGAIHWQVDLRAKGGIEHLLAWLACDEAGHAVFEVQCNVVAGHAVSFTSSFLPVLDIKRDKCRAPGGCSRSSAQFSWLKSTMRRRHSAR